MDDKYTDEVLLITINTLNKNLPIIITKIFNG